MVADSDVDSGSISVDGSWPAKRWPIVNSYDVGVLYHLALEKGPAGPSCTAAIRVFPSR
jgi:hypothetical protein